MTMSRRRIRELLADDEAMWACAAGLRYVSDEEAGFSRRRWGKGFTYRDEHGDTVRDRRLRERFASLAIPPAWEEVWICRDETGHIQATGRDSAGRKQYIYHRRWQEVHDERAVVRVVEACMEAPGYELFKYYAADGSKHDVKAQDVNDYLETVAGVPVTAKDFRVWGGTVCAASTLLRIAEDEAEEKAEDRLARALSAVAEQLWNTVAVCRDAYIHPRILAGFAAGELVPFLRRALEESEPRKGLSKEESAVLAYLEARRPR